MRDIWGVLLLMFSFVGVIKGRGLPYIIPYISAAVDILFLFYRGVFLKSKFAFLYTSALWLTLVWIAGKAMEEAWGRGIIAWVPLGTALLLTPLIGYSHQRMYRRFNPTTIRGLELESGINSQSSLLRKLWHAREKPSENSKIDLIVFDLGEEIQFRNK